MAKNIAVANDVTTDAIKEAHKALYEVMSKYIMDPEFDPDFFISNICYWYEFQQLAKAYGKKLIYFTPRAKKEEK